MKKCFFSLILMSFSLSAQSSLFRAKTTVVLRLAPNASAESFGSLPKGFLLSGVIGVPQETISGKTGRWLQISGGMMQYFVFTGFLEPVDHEFTEISQRCWGEKKRAVCGDNSYPIDESVMAELRVQHCGKIANEIFTGAGVEKVKQVLHYTATLGGDDSASYAALFFNSKNKKLVQVTLRYAENVCAQ